MWLFCLIFFFFSSRRRHTRWTGDWSSDVCSSDLGEGGGRGLPPHRVSPETHRHPGGTTMTSPLKIGRASCRERVEISVGAVSLKKKKKGVKEKVRVGPGDAEGGRRHREDRTGRQE